MLLLVFTVSLAFLVQAQNDVELSFQPPGEAGGIYKKGVYVNINCKVTSNVLDLLEIVKKDSSGETHTISTNDYLEEPFKKDGSYALLSTTSPDGVYTETSISIRDLQGADRGEIECRHIPLEGATHIASEAFDVQVPLKSVELLHYKEGDLLSVEDGTIVMKEGEDHGIICRVKVEDSEQSPIVDITLDGASVFSLFSVEEEKTVSGPSGLVQHNNTVIYELLTQDPIIGHHNKTLTCSGTMPGYENDPVTDTAKVEIQYAPRLVCDPAYGTMGQRMELNCEGQMNPGMKQITVKWTREPNSYQLDMETSDKDRHHLSIEESKNGRYQFKVTIDEIKEEDFGNYNFEVENPHSTVTKPVELLEVIPSTEPTPKLTTTPLTETKPDSSSTGSPSGASAVLSQVLTTMLLPLTTAVLHWS